MAGKTLTLPLRHTMDCFSSSSLVCERSPILISVRIGRRSFVDYSVTFARLAGANYMNARGKRIPTPADIRFGHKMRERRKMLRMSETELGAALGLFQQVPINLCSAKTEPRDHLVSLWHRRPRSFQ